jgi:hypothetical protein
MSSKFSSCTDTISFGRGSGTDSISTWPRLDMISQYKIVYGTVLYNPVGEEILTLAEFNTRYGKILRDIRFIYCGNFETQIIQDFDPVIRCDLWLVEKAGFILHQRRMVIYNNSLVEKITYANSHFALMPIGSVITMPDGQGSWTLLGENPFYSPLAKIWKHFELFLSSICTTNTEYNALRGKFTIDSLLDTLSLSTTGPFVLGIGTDIIESKTSHSGTEVAVTGSKICDLVYSATRSPTEFGGDGADSYYLDLNNSSKGLCLWLVDQLVQLEERTGISIRTCFFTFNYQALAKALDLKTQEQLNQCQIVVGKLATIYAGLLQSTAKELKESDVTESKSRVIVPIWSCPGLGLQNFDSTLANGKDPLIKVDPKIYLDTETNGHHVLSRTHSVEIFGIEPQYFNCHFFD